MPQWMTANLGFGTIYLGVTIAIIAYFFYYYINASLPLTGTVEWIDRRVGEKYWNTEESRFPLEQKDLLPLAAIAGVSLILPIFNPGGASVVAADIPATLAAVYNPPALTFGQITESFPQSANPPLAVILTALSGSLATVLPISRAILSIVFGALLIVITYIFLKNLFGKTVVATCATMLLAFDFMSFIQARGGTSDVFAVVFIFAAYMFMYRFITTDAEESHSTFLLNLGLSGTSIGLAFATNWVALGAGLGLIALLVIRLVSLHRRYLRENLHGYRELLIKIVIFSALFFIAGPLLIYILSYIPMGMSRGMSLGAGMLWDGAYYAMILENQSLMLGNHHALGVITAADAAHGHNSSWWQWIINSRPLVLYDSAATGSRAMSLVLGNPVIWWGGFVAILAMVYRVFTRRDAKALYILIGYLSLLLPFIFTTQNLFIFNYFPATVFLVLAFGHVFNTIIDRDVGRVKLNIYGLTAAAGVLFVMFYPAMTAMLVPYWYTRDFLRWLPGTWPWS